MSGRVKVTLADGRRVTGFRKTLRTIETRPARREPRTWIVSFLAPPTLFVTAHCQTGVVGVSVTDPGPFIHAIGVSREWVLAQVRAFLDKISAQPFEARAVCRRFEGAPDKHTGIVVYEPGTPIKWLKA